ncbi:MAG: hypothetical protein QXO30_00715 [Candidatus Caldarchaeum sp.]
MVSSDALWREVGQHVPDEGVRGAPTTEAPAAALFHRSSRGIRDMLVGACCGM